MKKLKLTILFLLFFLSVNYAQDASKYNMPGARNPILPGYFADPTIAKFGDIYYIYATTDNEMLASGAPTVWYSKDFRNWYNYKMEIPSLSSVNLRNFWAPDIIEGADGKYYLYFGNCQAGCNIYGYVSDTPVGPWKKLSESDKPVIPHDYPRQGFPSLDAQFFKDSNNSIYAYWGTWVHYNGGYAVGKLDNNTMASVAGAVNIPIPQTPNPFEAPYMMKKNNKYILMYSSESCHNETYHVRYSYADNPYGPFTPGTNNPILKTSIDKSVHGPGHHSVLKNNNDYYIVYHRHDYPFTRGGLARQVCIDSLIFENDSTIRPVRTTHEGITDFITSPVPPNIAYLAKTSASSSYHLQSLDYDYIYKPAQATDDNNATMWKAANNSFPQSLVIDLGAVKNIKRVMTQFEFSSYYYQYKIEFSPDSLTWQLFADKSDNRISGSPMIDDNNVNARYLKLTILATEKTGNFAAVWNIKVYESLFDIPLQLVNSVSDKDPGKPSTNSLLICLDLNRLDFSKPLTTIKNRGSLGGVFVTTGQVSLELDKPTGFKTLHFAGGALTLKDIPVPKSLEWNGAFTVATWVKNPSIDSKDECLASWCDRKEWQLANSYNALFYNSGNYGAAAHLDRYFDMSYKNLPPADTWHHLALTFDGVVEKIYVNGVLDNSQNMTLSSAIDKAKIIIGSSDVGEPFTGYMATFQMYDFALTKDKVNELMERTRPKSVPGKKVKEKGKRK
jgi:xylan 1,4-beta-xylosidase